jgi:hypothetical protein
MSNSINTPQFNFDEPITITLKLSYSFIPKDCLPDDFSGTKEDAIEYFRADVAENIMSWATPNEIYNGLTAE